MMEKSASSWLTLFCAAAVTCSSLAAAERPNIILIMTDDQGYGDLGVTGNPVLETPHIDALARGSASMKNFYVSLKLDGRSLIPLLDGRTDVDWSDRTLFIQIHRGDQPVLYHHFTARSQKWKLVRATGFGKEVPDRDAPFELYDLGADPGETRDVGACVG